MKFSKSLILSVFLICGWGVAPKALAYLSIAESGEILPSGTYQVGLEPQFLTNHSAGANLNVFFDTALSESWSTRVLLGAGAVDFNAFASAKWIPFPDVDNQPAMGLRFGAGIARDEDLNIVQVQVAPIASKKYDTEYGLTVPYIAVPFTLIDNKNEKVVASNIAFGAEYHHQEWNNVSFGGEIGLELSKSYSYISLFVSLPFDGKKGFGN